MDLSHNGTIKEIQTVFSYAVVCVYSWALLVFFWDLPGFMFYLSGWEIASYLAYQFAFALGESVLLTAAVTVMVRVFLFKKRKAAVSAAGALLVLSFTVSSVIFKEFAVIAQWLAQTFGVDGFNAARISAGLWAVSMLGLPILSLKMAHEKKVSDFINNAAENLSVLVFLYVTVSLFGIALVVYRNI